MNNHFLSKPIDFLDTINKKAFLNSIRFSCLSLRMTNYVYADNVKYEKVFRIKNNFCLKTVGYFD